MKPLAIRAAYSDFKLIKTRQVVQLVFEVPLSEVNETLDVIGGMPNPANERWFGIAPLDKAISQPETRPDKKDWRDLPPAQQAGIRCAEPVFQAFLKEQHPEDWREAQDAADCVRIICGVSSRSELSTNHGARVIWHQLDTAYQAWKALEHA